MYIVMNRCAKDYCPWKLRIEILEVLGVMEPMRFWKWRFSSKEAEGHLLMETLSFFHFCLCLLHLWNFSLFSIYSWCFLGTFLNLYGQLTIHFSWITLLNHSTFLTNPLCLLLPQAYFMQSIVPGFFCCCYILCILTYSKISLKSLMILNILILSICPAWIHYFCIT